MIFSDRDQSGLDQGVYTQKILSGRSQEGYEKGTRESRWWILAGNGPPVRTVRVMTGRNDTASDKIPTDQGGPVGSPRTTAHDSHDQDRRPSEQDIKKGAAPYASEQGTSKLFLLVRGGHNTMPRHGGVTFTSAWRDIGSHAFLLVQGGTFRVANLTRGQALQQ